MGKALGPPCPSPYRDTQGAEDEEDGQHPSEAGSYLAACCMYATIYNESPVGLTYLTENLDADTASKLQQIAAETVLNTD